MIPDEHAGFCEHCIEGGVMRSCPGCGLDLCSGCYGNPAAQSCAGCRRRDKTLRRTQQQAPEARD